MFELLQDVRLGRNDDFEFVVSPDALRFATHKVSFSFVCISIIDNTFHVLMLDF
jgi:hypothetical protein